MEASSRGKPTPEALADTDSLDGHEGSHSLTSPPPLTGGSVPLLDESDPAFKKYKRDRFHHCPSLPLSTAEVQAAFAAWAHSVDRTVIPSNWQLQPNPGLFTSSLNGPDDQPTLWHLLEGLHVLVPRSARSFISDFYTETLRSHMPYIQFLNLLEKLKFLHRLWKGQVMGSGAELSDDLLDAFASLGGEEDASGSASVVRLTELVAEFGVGADEVKQFVPSGASHAEEFAPLYDARLRLVRENDPDSAQQQTSNRSPQSDRLHVLSLGGPSGHGAPPGVRRKSSSLIALPGPQRVSRTNSRMSGTGSVQSVTTLQSDSDDEDPERRKGAKHHQTPIPASSVPGVDFHRFMGMASPKGSMKSGKPPAGPAASGLSKGVAFPDVDAGGRIKRATSSLGGVSASAGKSFVFATDVDITIPGPGPPTAMASSSPTQSKKRRQSRMSITQGGAFSPGLDAARHGSFNFGAAGRMQRTQSMRSQSSMDGVGGEKATLPARRASLAKGNVLSSASPGQGDLAMESTAGSIQHSKSSPVVDASPARSNASTTSQVHRSRLPSCVSVGTESRETPWRQSVKKLKPVSALSHPNIQDNPLMQRRISNYSKTVRQFR